MRIYVGNLAFRSNAEDVRKAFAAHGQVTHVELVIDRGTGRSAGYAFLEMPTDEEAQTAIARLNGKEINGRVVSVHVATPADNEPEPQSPWSRGGDRPQRGGDRPPRGGDNRPQRGGDRPPRGGDRPHRSDRPRGTDRSRG